MDSAQNLQPICGQEAVDLLNCDTESPYDQEKCVRLLEYLRQCVLNKKVKKFSLAESSQAKADTISKKQN